MKRLILIGSSFLFLFSAKSQQLRHGCNFLSNLNFINGTDTIFVEAVKLEMGRWTPRYPALLELEKEGKLKEHDFFYAVGFKLINCTEEFYIPARDTGKVAMNLFGTERGSIRVKLRLIVYENYKYPNHPFFIIDKIFECP